MVERFETGILQRAAYLAIAVIGAVFCAEAVLAMRAQQTDAQPAPPAIASRFDHHHMRGWLAHRSTIGASQIAGHTRSA
jgi:hypothetical protein